MLIKNRMHYLQGTRRDIQTSLADQAWHSLRTPALMQRAAVRNAFIHLFFHAFIFSQITLFANSLILNSRF